MEENEDMTTENDDPGINQIPIDFNNKTDAYVSRLLEHESQVEITISDIIEISNLDAREFLQTLLLKRFEGMALNEHGIYRTDLD